MAVADLHCRKTLVGTRWANSCLHRMNGLSTTTALHPSHSLGKINRVTIVVEQDIGLKHKYTDHYMQIAEFV